MKAELTGDGHELVITLNTDELPVAASDSSLRGKLPGSALGIADGIMDMIGQPPEPGEPRAIRVVRVRLVRAEVVAETILELPDARQVYA
jgi:hypothetical protein